MRKVLSLCLCFIWGCATAQTRNEWVYRGNEAYKKGNFKEAEEAKLG